MGLYQIILFCHVAMAVGLFVPLTIEWVSLSRLRRVSTFEQAREWVGLWKLLLPLGLPALLAVLGTGIYMATTVGSWDLGWVKVAVPALVLVAVAGAIIGPKRNRLVAALQEGSGPLPEQVWLQIHHPLLVASLRFRAAILAGLVFQMSAQPGPQVLPAVLALAVAALLGIALGLPAWSASSREAARAGSVPFSGRKTRGQASD